MSTEDDDNVFPIGGRRITSHTYGMGFRIDDPMLAAELRREIDQAREAWLNASTLRDVRPKAAWRRWLAGKLLNVVLWLDPDSVDF